MKGFFRRQLATFTSRSHIQQTVYSEWMYFESVEYFFVDGEPGMFPSGFQTQSVTQHGEPPVVQPTTPIDVTPRKALPGQETHPRRPQLEHAKNRPAPSPEGFRETLIGLLTAKPFQPFRLSDVVESTGIDRKSAREVAEKLFVSFARRTARSDDKEKSFTRLAQLAGMLEISERQMKRLLEV